MEKRKEAVHHPDHYNIGIEVIKFTDDWAMSFCAGNAVKYICRAPHKGSEIEDLKKARWYLNHLLDQVKNDQYIALDYTKTHLYTPTEFCESWRMETELYVIFRRLCMALTIRGSVATALNQAVGHLDLYIEKKENANESKS